MIGFDYTERIAPAALKAAGCVVAFRYLSNPGWPKNLAKAEADELLAAGIAIVLNYETSATFMLGGYGAGQACARSARAQANALGAPFTTRIYYSADFDVTAAQVSIVMAFLQGAASVDGAAEVDEYGGLRLAQAAAAAGMRPWQTIAWSGGVWDPHDVARQTGVQRTVGGVVVDVNDIEDLAALGAWGGPTSAGGSTMASLDSTDARTVWSYSHGDSPDVHQTLDNAAAWAGAANTKADTISSKADGISGKLDQLLARPIPPTADQIGAVVEAHLSGGGGASAADIAAAVEHLFAQKLSS